MPEPSSRLLCPDDLANLRASGLTDATIRANGLRTEGSALKFVYRDLDGRVNGFTRHRPHTPRLIGGRLAKYVQPAGTAVRAYFPAGDNLTRLRDARSPLYVTEGEKKSMLLAQHGLAAVGLGGVDGGARKSAAGGHELIPDLAALPLAGRAVFLVPDTDPKADTRAHVAGAMARLRAAFLAVGAGAVHVVELPLGPAGGKQGADDFAVANGLLALGVLLGAAGGGGKRIIPVIPPGLGEDAYHGPVGDFLRAVGPHTEATDAALLAHVLAAVGVRIGPGPYVYAGGCQPARVNAAVVGPTSTGRKGTAAGVCDDLMKRVDPRFWAAQRAGGLSTGEGLISRVADVVRTDPKSKGKVVEPQDKRLYVLEPELSRVLGVIRREGSTLSQVMRESYDTGDLSVMTRAAPLQARGAHISIVGHITPEELRDRMNHVEMANGFANRFLWVYSRSAKLLPRCERIPDSVFGPLVKVLKPLANLPDRLYELSPDAAGWWEDELYPLLREDRPGFVGAMTARGTAMVLRLALLYSLLDPPPSPGLARVVGRPHLAAGLAVWRYCEASVDLLFADRPGTSLGDKLLDLLAAGPLSKDKLNDHLSPDQKRQADAALTELVAAGRVRQATQKKTGPGRPATVFERVG